MTGPKFVFTHPGWLPSEQLHTLLTLTIGTLIILGLLASYDTARAQTFDEICSLPTTVNCWDFESEDDLYYGWPDNTSCDYDDFLQTHTNGRNRFGLDRQTLGNMIARADNLDGECIYPRRDASRSASGVFSLKIRQPSQSAAFAGGAFNPVFKRFGTPGNYTFARFGPGGEFWVRFAMWQNRGILSTVYWAKGRGAKSNNGGIKRLIIHGYESSENLEETIVDGWHRRIPVMYSNSGTEGYGAQDHIGCFEKSSDPADYPEPPCRHFIASQWSVYQVHIIVGTAAGNDGLVELYLDDEPEPIIRVLDANHSSATGAPYSENAVWDTETNGYGKLSFTFFATNKDPNQVHPEGIVWYDDVIVSKVRVPPLNKTAGGRTRLTEKFDSRLTDT